MMHQLGTYILIFNLFGITVTLSDERKDILNEFGKVERTIQKISDRKDSLEKQASTLAAQTNQLRIRASKAAHQTQVLEKTLSIIDGRLSRLAYEKKVNQRRLKHLQLNLIQSVIALVRLRRQPESAMLSGSETLLDAVRAERLLALAAPALQKDSIKLQSLLRSNREIRQKLKNQQNQKKTAITALLIRRTELNNLWNKRAARERHLRKAGIVEGRRLAELAIKAKDLNSLVQRLEWESRSTRLYSERQTSKTQSKQIVQLMEKNRSKSAAQIARSLSGSPQKPTKPKYASPKHISPKKALPEQKLALSTQIQPFFALPGRLRLPAQGKMISQFGESSGFGAHSQGTTLHTRQGALVVSPYEGSVVFAGPFRNYGLMLIIAHGEGYHTLLAGLSKLQAVVGQHLLTGEPVGTMGKDKKRSLYIELRRKGKPINPNPWWSKSRERVSG